MFSVGDMPCWMRSGLRRPIEILSFSQLLCLVLLFGAGCSNHDGDWGGPTGQPSPGEGMQQPGDSCAAGAAACPCPDGSLGSRACADGIVTAEPCTCADVGEPSEHMDPLATGGTISGGAGPDGGVQPAGDAGGIPITGPDPVGPGTVVSEPGDEAAYVYDQDELRVFEVEIAPADLAVVDADPSAEQYVPAVLHFEGQSYDVGYRYKGSIGAFLAPCTSGFGGGAKQGKCSVKLSFNWVDPEARFMGLKKLQFHSMNNDSSWLRERLGYTMFREMGVPAPRAVHAILSVNGQPELFALVEQIDGRFTRSRFTEGGKGNLYKEVWPLYTTPDPYLNALKTNEDENPSVDRMVQLQAAVQEGAASFEGWVDRDAMARYMAVDRVIMNDDGAFHLYCYQGAIGNNTVGPANHNYYWYEATDHDRFWIIPWDLDHSMQEVLGAAHIAADWRVPQTNCGGCGFGSISGPAPGCDPVIANFQDWMTDYDAMVDQFIAGPFSKGNVDGKLAVWRAQIEAAGYSVPAGPFNELTAILDRARTNRGFQY